MRERGLKLFLLAFSYKPCKVAPRAGAWIETQYIDYIIFHVVSLPVRERGLKPSLEIRRSSTRRVAPRAGAWIETDIIYYIACALEVAPRAGAWIETIAM